MRRSLTALLIPIAMGVLLVLTGCGPDEPALAEAALREFFAALSEGRFDDAAGLYGGDYEELIAINPDVDPQDHARLLERWCTQNGGVCLPVGEVVTRDDLGDDGLRLRVTFVRDDGTRFEIGPCCGEPDTGQRTFEFDYVVRRLDGDLGVLQLPPFVP